MKYVFRFPLQKYVFRFPTPRQSCQLDRQTYLRLALDTKDPIEDLCCIARLHYPVDKQIKQAEISFNKEIQLI